MAEARCAMAESVIASIVADDVDELATAVTTTADDCTWRSVLRYELPIEQLVDVGGLLHYDVFASKLLCIGCTRALTPWHIAALRGADDALTMFVERLELPVDCRLPNSGTTALQLACFAGHTDTVRALIDRLKADVNRRDEYGWTALHYAAVEGQFNVVELLLGAGVDVRQRDKDGATAAYRAHVAHHDDVVCLMKSALADNDDLLTLHRDDDDRSRQPPESLYAHVRKLHTTGNNTVRLGESEYQLASTANGEGKTMMADELVRRVIGQQLREVLGDDDENTYIAPLPSFESPSSQRPSNIGYDTLTRVLREELRRFRADGKATGHGQAASTSSDSVTATAGGGGGGGNRTGMNDYEEIDDLISVISERDHRTEGGDAGSDDDAPQHPPPPLPLLLRPPPPRGDGSSASSPPTGDADRAGRPSTVAGPPSRSAAAPSEFGADCSVRRRTAPVDDDSVIRLLQRIEQSSAEIDASFTALVNVGLRCPGDWQRLARQLPICKPSKLARRISLIEARYRGDTRQQAAAALAEWRSQYRDKATLRELVAALRRCDLLEEARFLDSISEESAV